ncbi:MAG: 4-hydroxy-tetrahydrodipicolinate reductase [Thermodesulfobacteriota bacterium]|nr:4-hydroxy-tetrahydrodipicolinate reductase [Thermodesulfobacteriota bacterium]
MMLKSIVVGASGRMGNRIIHAINETGGIDLIAGVEFKGHPAIGRDAGELVGLGKLNIDIKDNLKEVIHLGDVIIDFTNNTASMNHLKIAAENNVPIVIGSTGFSSQQIEEVRELSKNTRCVISPNMSVGVNLLFKIIQNIGEVLKDDYDIEIIEAHHRFKKDSPSGTAMKIAQILAETLKRDINTVGVYGRKGNIGERTQQEIGIQAVRAGDIVGEHTVIFGGLGERLEVTHRAHSREGFARGAVKAAKWVVHKENGLYDMQDVMELR